MKLLNQRCSQLTPFSEIMDAVLPAVDGYKFSKVKARGLFSDGFLWANGGMMNSGALQSFLVNQQLNVRTAITTKNPLDIFVLLDEESHDLQEILPKLLAAAHKFEEIRQKHHLGKMRTRRRTPLEP